MAPDAGFEPATKWLTATYSTAELIRNKQKSRLYRKILPLSRVESFVWDTLSDCFRILEI